MYLERMSLDQGSNALFIENRNSSKHPPIDMTRLSYPFGVAIHSRSVIFS